MNIVVDVNHPADVHVYKNFVREMQKRGHEVLITASNKEISYKLLELYDFDYVKLGTYGISLIEKILKTPLLDLEMYKAVKNFKPDIFIGAGIRAAHVSSLMKKPYISLCTADHALSGTAFNKFVYLFCYPFTDTILTPSCFSKDLGKKQIRFEGYLELAYLHPKYFKPDPSVLDVLNLNKDDKFTVLRFVSWDAVHDRGHHGIKNRLEFVKKIEEYGQIFITSEGRLEKSLEKYRITLSPDKFHDLLFYATLYLGEGAAIASEAAILGTPSIYVSSLAGILGFLYELEQKYDLMYSFSKSDDALKKAMELLETPNIKEDWRIKKEYMLKDKIDVTEYMIQFIENYPIKV